MATLKRWDSGPETNLSLLFIHGWGCTHQQMAPLVARLDGDFHCISVDLLGHGASPRATGYAIAAQCDAVTEVLDGSEHLLAIGHSMGGQIALELAARGTVSAAILLDPAPITPHQAAKKFVANMCETLPKIDISTFMEVFARKQFRAPVESERVEQFVASMKAMNPDVARAAWQGIADFDGHDALHRLARPCLAIFADKPLNDVKAFAKASDHVETAQTACAGHMQQLEVPEQLEAMIRRFISQNYPKR
ncbi:MAG: alpha/beta hydrolase [Pseudomonadota bacterium]